MMTHKRCVAGGGLLIRDRAGCQPAPQLCQWESATGVAQSRTLARPGGDPEGGAMYGWQATVRTDGKGAKSVQKGTEKSKLDARICGFGGKFLKSTKRPSSQAPEKRQTPIESGASAFAKRATADKQAHAMASQARHEFVAQQELCASRNVVQDAGATKLRADGESESVSRNETCASRIAVPGRQRGLGGKSGGFRSKSRSKYRVIPHNPA